MNKNNILQLYPELNKFVDINNLPAVDPYWLSGFSDGFVKGFFLEFV